MKIKNCQNVSPTLTTASLTYEIPDNSSDSSPVCCLARARVWTDSCQPQATSRWWHWQVWARIPLKWDHMAGSLSPQTVGSESATAATTQVRSQTRFSAVQCNRLSSRFTRKAAGDIWRTGTESEPRARWCNERAMGGNREHAYSSVQEEWQEARRVS